MKKISAYKILLSFVAIGVLATTIVVFSTFARPLKTTGMYDYLIQQAWSRDAGTISDNSITPWPWLNSKPIAKIRIPSIEQEHVILQGSSSRVLRHAPGWHEGTALPGQPGISLVMGYANKHFKFLHQLKKGDKLILENQQGRNISYIVDDIAMVQDKEIKIEDTGDENILILSTSYAFENWQSGEKIQLVIIAREDNLLG